MNVWEFLFWISLYAVFHSYVIFPFLLKIITRGKTLNKLDFYENEDCLPGVSIVMAVHNEEKVIERKIRSVFNTSYPKEKIEFLVGSDNSTDNTNEILKRLEREFPSLKVTYFDSRQGKVRIINELVKQTSFDVVISTDAKAFFLENTIYELVKYLKDDRVAAAGGFLENRRLEKDGISKQEDFYMDREMYIKYWETLYGLCPVGLYGAMYSIKKDYYTPVPENLLVDDFFITMKVYEQGKGTVFNPEAKAEEDLPNKITEEFKRKVRIATGDFQNVKIFKKFVFSPFTKIGFCFLSHKILRWFTPFFMLIGGSALLFLWNIDFYKWLFYTGAGVSLLPLFDFVLGKFGIHLSGIRMITHFYAMNLALFLGFFKALKGVEKGIWEPSKRHN